MQGITCANSNMETKKESEKQKSVVNRDASKGEKEGYGSSDSDIKKVKEPYIYAEGLTLDEKDVLINQQKLGKSVVGKKVKYNELNALRDIVKFATDTDLSEIILNFGIEHKEAFDEYKKNKGASISRIKAVTSELETQKETNKVLIDALTKQGMSIEEIDKILKG